MTQVSLGGNNWAKMSLEPSSLNDNDEILLQFWSAVEICPEKSGPHTWEYCSTSSEPESERLE
jgi:hypothetical protein